MLRRFAIAGLFAVAAATAAVAWIWFPWVFSPSYTIRIASGPLGSDGQKFLSAFRRELSEEHPRVRLILEDEASLERSATALQGGKADLAVARSDHPVVASGGTIVVLSRIALVIMAPANSPAATMKDLLGKKIALLDGAAPDDPLLRTVMDFYGLDSRQMVSLGAAQVGAALASKRIAAVVALGPIGPGAIADALKAIVKASKKPLKFINLESRAITEQSPVYEPVEIPPGAFVAAPASPQGEVTTVAVTVRLVATKTMLNDVAGEITRLLLVTRAKLAATLPRIAQVEAPDTDKKGVLPVHPGAAAYLDGSQVSFFEEAMNILFNISIIGGVTGTLALWVRASWRRRRPSAAQQILVRLSVLWREVRTAPREALNGLDDELDDVSGALLDEFVGEQISADRFSGIAVMIAQIRYSIDRRQQT